MPCSECGRFVPIENKDLGICATCNHAMRDDRPLYPLARQMFLEWCIRHDITCPIKGTPITMDSDIHHKKGRIGYADEEKRRQGISLLTDPEYFLACSREGHQWIEAAKNRKKAERLGYILPRLSNGLSN